MNLHQEATLAVLFAEIPVARIAFLKFILEGYDGLATLTTIDRERGLVAMACFPDCREELVALLEALHITLNP
ncbi:MAG: DUF4911 domain-containing protein [Desulfurivibrionaceae bacterium]|nr:DUF4911 domain-containing protein [Desulfurivibrionaceae bacterium]